MSLPRLFLFYSIFFLIVPISSGFASKVESQTLPKYDFVKTPLSNEWRSQHDIRSITQTEAGMEIDISGSDPYLYGPKADYPPGQLLWLKLRIKSEKGGSGQLFYFQKDASEEASVHFSCRKGVWEDVRVPVPALGSDLFLRIDPPGVAGKCTISALSFEPRNMFKEPDWAAPDLPRPTDPNFAVTSGGLKMIVSSAQLNDFEIEVNGKKMAVGYTHAPIGVLTNRKPEWMERLFEKMLFSRARKMGDAIFSDLKLGEPDGTIWELTQRYAPSKTAGAIDVEIQWTVSKDREVLFLPTLVLFPGVGSFGATKDHAIFAGLEYLDRNEPSSSEADIRGPGSHRQVPDNLRVTFPLMGIQAEERYLGISWKQNPSIAPLFDTPDRHFHSAGSVMGLIFPGSDGGNREEGSLLPYEPVRLKAGIPVTLNATIYGGMGKGVVPIVQQFVSQNGLPNLPKTGFDLEKYYSLASAGWLDSGLGSRGKYRHALPGNFGLGSATDAAIYLDWLSQKTKRPGLVQKLSDASKLALEQSAPDDLAFGGVSHIRYPVGTLLYGHLEENLARAERESRGALKRFESDGTILYRRDAKGEDLGKTHFERHADGLTAPIVSILLERASLCGSNELISEGLRLLDTLDRYENSAPRGAQTWEVPLHTPDILASAYLVKAYLLGYQLTNKPHYLAMAKHWAWTGVPFVYIASPNLEKSPPEYSGIGANVKETKKDPVGVYSTIAVFGATQWVAPNWMGLPVQWCGLVYAESLYQLFKYDPNPIWKQLADGITLSGIQQTFPIGDDPLRQGLLPDSFNLRQQTQNDPAINPGTVQAPAVQLLTGIPLYEMRVFHAKERIILHAPGAISISQITGGGVTFDIKTWTKKPYDLLLLGFKKAPTVLIERKSVSLEAPNRYDDVSGRLIIHLTGDHEVQLVL